MSKREGREVLREAKRAGAAYAREQIEGEHFSDYVATQVYASDPEDLPTTKKEATRVAHGMLVDLYHDMERDLRFQDTIRLAGASGLFNFGSADYVRDRYGIDASDVSQSFFDGASSVLFQKGVAEWLGDEILFRSSERRGEVA